MTEKHFGQSLYLKRQEHPSMKPCIIGSFTLISLAIFTTVAWAEPSRTCHFDPDLGKPNPLGMRSYISLTEEDSNTTFLFEQFPSNVGDGSDAGDPRNKSVSDLLRNRLRPGSAAHAQQLRLLLRAGGLCRSRGLCADGCCSYLFPLLTNGLAL
jgi:hypothetical protein